MLRRRRLVRRSTRRASHSSRHLTTLHHASFTGTDPGGRTEGGGSSCPRRSSGSGTERDGHGGRRQPHPAVRHRCLAPGGRAGEWLAPPKQDSRPLASRPGALEVLRFCTACPWGTLLRRRRPRTQAGTLRLPSRLLVPFMLSVTHCSVSTRPLPPRFLTNQLPPFDRLWRASSAGTGCQGPRRTTCRSQQRRAPTRSRCGWRWRACRQELAGPTRRAAGACAEGSRAQQPASRLLTTAQRCRQAALRARVPARAAGCHASRTASGDVLVTS